MSETSTFKEKLIRGAIVGGVAVAIDMMDLDSTVVNMLGGVIPAQWAGPATLFVAVLGADIIFDYLLSGIINK